MLRTGDIYNQQKAFISFESDSEGEQEEEEEEEEQDNGLGGSSPIPSIHHSFEEDDTLTHGNKVEDEFSQEEEEGDEQTMQDEQFLSVLSELNSLNSSIDESAKKSQTKSKKFKGASDALRETKRLKEKCELLLPNISPQLQTQVYRKIDWSNFTVPAPGLGTSSTPTTSTPTRQTRSAGPAANLPLPDQPPEYKDYKRKK
jgi:hypothetical protein